jgi:hypothetical protein
MAAAWGVRVDRDTHSGVTKFLLGDNIRCPGLNLERMAARLALKWEDLHFLGFSAELGFTGETRVHPALLKYVGKLECSSEDRQAIKEFWTTHHGFLLNNKDELWSRRKSFQHLLDYEVVRKYLQSEGADKKRIMMVWEVLVWEIALLDELIV